MKHPGTWNSVYVERTYVDLSVSHGHPQIATAMSRVLATQQHFFMEGHKLLLLYHTHFNICINT